MGVSYAAFKSLADTLLAIWNNQDNVLNLQMKQESNGEKVECKIKIGGAIEYIFDTNRTEVFEKLSRFYFYEKINNFNQLKIIKICYLLCVTVTIFYAW